MSPISESKCSETWISPHFEYTKAYYDMLFAPSPVLVMPYFWEPRFCMEKKSVMEFDTDNIRVAVVVGAIAYHIYLQQQLAACDSIAK